MKAGTYWTLGPDGWVLFEIRAWAIGWMRGRSAGRQWSRCMSCSARIAIGGVSSRPRVKDGCTNEFGQE